MSMGELAGLIAALAFAVLVIFLCLNLAKISELIKDIRETVNRLNTTIDVVTKDVDNLSIEVEGLLNKSNTLVDDINGKLSKTDPLFVAIGDIGYSVSDLNHSTKELASNIVSGITPKKKKRNFFQTIGKLRETQTVKEEVNTASKENLEMKASNDANESELFTISSIKPSTTAGEISIKEEGMNKYE